MREHGEILTLPAEGTNKLTGMAIKVTAQERDRLHEIATELSMKPREVLETFVADLTNSARRGYPHGKYRAEDWLQARRDEHAYDSRKGGLQ